VGEEQHMKIIVNKSTNSNEVPRPQPVRPWCGGQSKRNSPGGTGISSAEQLNILLGR